MQCLDFQEFIQGQVESFDFKEFPSFCGACIPVFQNFSGNWISRNLIFDLFSQLDLCPQGDGV